MLTRTLAVAALVLATACGGSDSGDDKARLVDAHAALCEAAARPADARSLFFDRSHDALHEVARRLEDTDRAQAAQLLEAKQKVESELEATRAATAGDLLRLADVYRTSLGRLAIDAPPCEK